MSFIYERSALDKNAFMKSILLPLLLSLFCWMDFIQAAPEDDLQKTLWENAFDLYREIDKKNDNLIFSPYGATTLMSLIYGGAEGETAAQISQGFKFNRNPLIHDTMNELIQKINNLHQEGVLDLFTKNSLWVHRDFLILPTFLELVKTKYQAHVQNLDLQGNPLGSTELINQWVSDQTRQFIPSIVTENQVKQSEMIAINTLYMKGQWQSPFDEKLTREMTFYGLDNKKILAPLMQKHENMMYSENDQFQALQLKYQGKQSLHFFILLPRKKGHFTDYEKNLGPAVVEDLSSALQECKVQLIVPKFAFDSMIQLVETSQNLGVRNLFDASLADLSNISGKKDLFVAQYFQKAKIELNEKGTEAAAVTAMGLARSVSVPRTPPSKTFTADHPFLFYIIEPQSKTILFMGRVLNPTKN